MITVKNLSKRYARTVAVDHISFEIQKGQVVGFLGPNGAGKTTTMRILTCFMPPSEGKATGKKVTQTKSELLILSPEVLGKVSVAEAMSVDRFTPAHH